MADEGWAVPLSDLEVDEEIEAAVMAAVRSCWWSTGSTVAQFEREFAAWLGVSHAMALANGTAALHLALLAIGCRPGDEVILPSLNFVAAANAIRHTGASPVFCDITGEADLSMSPHDVEAAITPATRAVVVLHYGGHPSRIDEILDIAERHSLLVVEDAAHAPGAAWNGRKCGTFGDVGCFSFFANKNLPTGEGGMCVTDDDELAERIRLLRSHGMTALTWDRIGGHAHSYDVVAQGFNYRMDELRAAIGIVQLRRLDRHNAARAAIASSYREALDEVRGLVMPPTLEDAAVSAHHLAVVVLPPTTARNEFRALLAANGIQTSVHYPPIHQFSLYRDAGSRRPLPVTDALASRIVTLPLFPGITRAEAGAVTETVLAAV